MIATALPAYATDLTIRIGIVDIEPQLVCAFLASLNSLVFDYVCRNKINDTHLSDFIVYQLPAPAPETYRAADLDFIVPRVLELSYTAWDMQPFAEDLGFDGEPFRWDSERRAVLRAELDAYYAWLYGLTRDELRYILDPKDVVGEDFPSETFRVLKEREEKPPPRGFGEYRTRRLVLEAFDRFHEDGTFEAARVRDPHYFETITRQLATATTELQMTKAELEETKRTLAALLSKADRDELPTLFVEGDDDAKIVVAAWQVFFPAEAMPFKVVSAGGTMQMRPLAVAGKALRPIIGDRLLLALADNDGEGRDLWRDGRLHQGGSWRQQTNGVWWCLLLSSDEFREVMSRFKIDPAYWPYTIENAFPAALRQQALAEGAYALAKVPQADFLKEQRISTRVLEALADLPEDDAAVLYLRRPTPEAKGAFAAWITDAERLTRVNYAAFELIFIGLKLVIAQHQAEHAAAAPPRQVRLV